MRIPPDVDQHIRQQLNNLVEQSQGRIDDTAYYSLRSQFISLANFLSRGEGSYTRVLDDLMEYNSNGDFVLRGVIQGLKADYEAGMFDTLASRVEASVTADYLGQAEQLLGEGISGQFDHVPAAVLAGAVLEDALRRLCQRQSPPIEVRKANGEYKGMMRLIDELRDAGLYSELKAAQLRAWAHIRNKAAHGEFDQFSRSDVETMIPGARSFLADYL